MCDTYMGVEIETLVEDGVTLYKSKYSDWSQFIEDVQADIADYFDGERDAYLEFKRDEAIDMRLTGE
jgi:hypothetical protein